MPSAKACDQQLASGMVECPVCGDTGVQKALMAPAVQSSERVERVRAIEAEWVGGNFAKEARAIEAGEVEERAVVGTATPEEVESLIDDGIDFTLLGPRPRTN